MAAARAVEICERGNRRVRGRNGRRRGHRSLLPRDEHPPAGGTPGDRGGDRARPGPAPAADRRRCTHPPRGPRRRGAWTARARGRGTPLRGGPGEGVAALHRHLAALRDRQARHGPCRRRSPIGQRGESLLRPDAGQGDRPCAEPGRGQRLARVDPRDKPDPRGGHQPRPAGPDLASPRVRGRRDGHRIPRATRARTARRSARRRSSPRPSRGGRGARRTIHAAARRPSAAERAERLPQQRCRGPRGGLRVRTWHRVGRLCIRPARSTAFDPSVSTATRVVSRRRGSPPGQSNSPTSEAFSAPIGSSGSA